MSLLFAQPCAQRLRKRLCVMCSASHDAIAKYQHSDCLAGAKIRQKKAFVKSILRKGYSFLALTIEIRQKKCCYLKKSTFLCQVDELFVPGLYLGKRTKPKGIPTRVWDFALQTALRSRVQMVFERNINTRRNGRREKTASRGNKNGAQTRGARDK